jgi:hypothetical protein
VKERRIGYDILIWHNLCGLFSKSFYPVLAGEELIAQREAVINEEIGVL